MCTWFQEHWPKTCPVELVMEGLPDESVTTFPRGTPLERTQFKCILDPIDGTRGLMYDKRSAWILAGLAPQRGKRTRLSDIHVAVMTELPTSKQQRSDQLSAIRGEGVVATQRPGLIGRRKPLRMQPSGARTFEHGFASFCRFFPEGKKALSTVEEQIWRELELYGKDGGARVFEDQYISSGGQLYELMVGHDRMIADLRPVVFAKLGLGKSAMCCHPYDICTALILEELGGVVETPEGKVLSAPLDTVSSVAWVGYANPILARQMRPVLTRALRAL
ncbi:MAG TPA: inositol monophosphatase [Opitutaceae bacterium]|nr:inositol monophosphatase [Opitutaceae bacterium]